MTWLHTGHRVRDLVRPGVHDRHLGIAWRMSNPRRDRTIEIEEDIRLDLDSPRRQVVDVRVVTDAADSRNPLDTLRSNDASNALRTDRPNEARDALRTNRACETGNARRSNGAHETRETRESDSANKAGDPLWTDAADKSCNARRTDRADETRDTLWSDRTYETLNTSGSDERLKWNRNRSDSSAWTATRATAAGGAAHGESLPLRCGADRWIVTTGRSRVWSEVCRCGTLIARVYDRMVE